MTLCHHVRYTCSTSYQPPMEALITEMLPDADTNTDLYVLKSSSLSLKPLLRSMLIPLRASSASLIRSGFSSSTLPAADSAGSAIEISDTGDEELKAAGGGREGARGGVWLVYFPARKESQPVAQFGVNAGECIFPARGQVQSNWGLTAHGRVGEPSVVPADESLLHIPPPHRCVWVLRDTPYVK